MSFEIGKKTPGGQHLSEETKAKVITDRKAGKKWKDIAAELGVPTKRAMTWAKRAWYKKGMSAEKVRRIKGEDVLQKIKDKDKEEPTTDGGKEEPTTDGGKSDSGTGEVDKAKDKAGKIVTDEIRNHINKDDKAPNSVSKVRDKGKEDTEGVDKVAKKGLSVSKSVGMWFLLAIIIAVVVIFVVFLLLKPSKLEKGDYNQPTGKRSPDGLDGRNIDDL